MGLGDRGDRDIIMGSAKQDLSKMEIEIQTLGQGETIISSIGIPFPVSTRIHKFEDYVQDLIKEKEHWSYATGSTFGSVFVSPDGQNIAMCSLGSKLQ